MKKVEVHLDRPDWKDPDVWAKTGETYIAWLRQAVPQLDLDTKRIIIGFIFRTIIGDDRNCFGPYYMADMIETAQRHLQIRMDTEINTPEIPEDIRQQLIRVGSQLHGIDWNSPAGYSQAVTTWKTGVLDYVQQQIDSHKEYRDVIDDYEADAMTLMPLWNKFLYGKIARPRTISCPSLPTMLR